MLREVDHAGTHPKPGRFAAQSLFEPARHRVVEKAEADAAGASRWRHDRARRAREGYLNVSIAQVSARAGVSSATFYEQFDGKEDCLLAAYRAARGRVYRQVLPVPEEGNWSDAARSMLGGLFSELQREPDVGRLLFVEALAGGPHLRGERERSLGEFASTAGGVVNSGTTPWLVLFSFSPASWKKYVVPA
jgi:AcrR family transcriptional regulator